MPDKKTMLIVAVTLLSAAVIIGAMFTIAERFDHRIELESKISELKSENCTTGGSPGPDAEDAPP